MLPPFHPLTGRVDLRVGLNLSNYRRSCDVNLASSFDDLLQGCPDIAPALGKKPESVGMPVHRISCSIQKRVKDEDVPGFSIFSRRDGTVRHFYSGENEWRDGRPKPGPARRPRSRPLWLMLDLMPEGRGTDRYPKLNYRLLERNEKTALG